MSSAVQYQQWDPSPDLAGAIRCVWSLRGDADGATQPIVSDGCVEIVVNLADAFEQVTEAGPTRQPLAMVVGPTALPTVVRPTGAIDVLGIRLQPWAAAQTLGIGMRELRDRMMPLDDMGGRSVKPLRQLVHELHDARTDHARLAVTRRAFTANNASDLDGVARRAVERVAASDQLPSVRQLAAGLGASMRTVQRVFADDVGLSPKTLLRIVRVQRALGLALGAPDLTWSTIAARAGYHDQSHFVRDFRALVGCTPTQFRPDVESITASFVEEIHDS